MDKDLLNKIDTDLINKIDKDLLIQLLLDKISVLEIYSEEMDDFDQGKVESIDTFLKIYGIEEIEKEIREVRRIQELEEYKEHLESEDYSEDEIEKLLSEYNNC